MGEAQGGTGRRWERPFPCEFLPPSPKKMPRYPLMHLRPRRLLSLHPIPYLEKRAYLDMPSGLTGSHVLFSPNPSAVLRLLPPSLPPSPAPRLATLLPRRILTIPSLQRHLHALSQTFQPLSSTLNR